MTASQRRNALRNTDIYKGPTFLDVIADAIREGNATEALSSPKADNEGGETAEGGGDSPESQKSFAKWQLNQSSNCGNCDMPTDKELMPGMVQ